MTFYKPVHQFKNCNR